MALLYEGESYKIRGACFAVFNNLGGGIKEKIIEKALFKGTENFRAVHFISKKN